MPRGERGVRVSRRKAERAFTPEGRSPFEQLVHDEFLRAKRADLSNSAQLTAKRRSKRAPRHHDYDMWLIIARRALASGGKMVRPGVIEWDASGGCLDPPRVTLTGVYRPFPGFSSGRFRRVHTNERPAYYMDVDVPCRRCTRCLARRAAHWRYRMQTEMAASARTWFGTLTLNPDEHARTVYRASKRIGVLTFGGLSDSEKFLERHRECGDLITKWLKRVREATGAPMRYVVVVEAHKSGLPHYHLLVHETDAFRPIRWRDLSTQWARHGFSNFKLVEDPLGRARYVAKYLTKSAEGRVRASVRYGQPSASPLRPSEQSAT